MLFSEPIKRWIYLKFGFPVRSVKGGFDLSSDYEECHLTLSNISGIITVETEVSEGEFSRYE